jgi:hypothetical protein
MVLHSSSWLYRFLGPELHPLLRPFEDDQLISTAMKERKV